MLGEVGIVSTTPALVPTHSSSAHTNSAVILRQAALCCRMMASEPGGKSSIFEPLADLAKASPRMGAGGQYLPASCAQEG